VNIREKGEADRKKKEELREITERMRKEIRG